LFTFNKPAWEGFVKDAKAVKTYEKRGTSGVLNEPLRSAIKNLSRNQWNALRSRSPNKMNIEIGWEFTVAVRAKRKKKKDPLDPGDLVGGMPVIVEDWPTLHNYP